jgi:hypothetical protein
MEPALTLLERAQRAGLRLAPNGDELIVRGPKRLARLVDELRPHAQELLRLLRERDEALVETYTGPAPLAKVRRIDRIEERAIEAAFACAGCGFGVPTHPWPGLPRRCIRCGHAEVPF